MAEPTAGAAGAGHGGGHRRAAGGLRAAAGAEHADAIAAVAARIAEQRPRHVVFTARGTSDHAALYGAYLTEIRLGIPAGLASPSAITVYGARPDLRDALVVGVSQSGGSPDLVEVVRVAREHGALTLAVTNDPDSPLAEAAELHLDVAAGHERAVAATKTYTAELLALLLLVEGVRAGGALPGDERSALADAAGARRRLLADPTPADIAGRYRFAGRAGHHRSGVRLPDRPRGGAQADGDVLPAGARLLRRRPAARPAGDDRRRTCRCWPSSATGRPAQSMREVLTRLGERRADVVVIGPSAIDGVRLRIATPAVDERYAPLLDILPLQRLALALALARGEDPDAPRGLNKVTITR